MTKTAILPLPLELADLECPELSHSLEERHFREYTSVYTKYNPETQVRETSDGVPVPPKMSAGYETATLHFDTWDSYYDDDE